MSSSGVVAERAGEMRSDSDLVAGVRDGDDAAFEQLYRRYHHRIRSFVLQRLHDTGRAEDVAQEAFLSALRRLRATDSDIAFKPWLFEIARNAAIDVHRRTSRAEEVPVDEQTLAGAPAPDAEVFTREQLALLSGAFDELPEVHHRALVMREFEGRSYREIGERLDLTRSAVESTLFRARRRLEHEYGQLEAGKHCESSRATMAMLAEGVEPGARRRHRFVRHTRRCLTCRRHARELGVAPLPRFAGLRERAAALVPFSLLLRRRAVEATAEGAASGGALTGSGLQLGSGLMERAASLLACAALAGAGGAVVHHGVDGSQPQGQPGTGSAAPAAETAPAAPERLAPGSARQALPTRTGTVRERKAQRASSRRAHARHDRFATDRAARRKAAPAQQPGGRAAGPTAGGSGTQPSTGLEPGGEAERLGAPTITGSHVPRVVAGQASAGLPNVAPAVQPVQPVQPGLQGVQGVVDQTTGQATGLLEHAGSAGP
jgi:RNA polymerase sigma factor (sigma-70 family)